MWAEAMDVTSRFETSDLRILFPFHANWNPYVMTTLFQPSCQWQCPRRWQKNLGGTMVPQWSQGKKLPSQAGLFTWRLFQKTKNTLLHPKSHLSVRPFCYSGLTITHIWLTSEIHLFSLPRSVGKSWGKCWYVCMCLYLHKQTKTKLKQNLEKMQYNKNIYLVVSFIINH